MEQNSAIAAPGQSAVVIIPPTIHTELAEADLSLVFQPQGMAEYRKALMALSTATIPDSVIQSHPGKGGKMFTYIDHVWMKDTVRNALGIWWDFQATNGRVFEDGSAVVDCTLRIHIPLPNGVIFTREFTEQGAFEARQGMALAYRIASAASRGFVRVVALATGCGLQFYRKETEMAPQDHWNMLAEYAQKIGVDPGELKGRLKNSGIDTLDKIANQFERCYKILHDLNSEKQGKPPAIDFNAAPEIPPAVSAPAPVSTPTAVPAPTPASPTTHKPAPTGNTTHASVQTAAPTPVPANNPTTEQKTAAIPDPIPLSTPAQQAVTPWQEVLKYVTELGGSMQMFREQLGKKYGPAANFEILVNTDLEKAEEVMCLAYALFSKDEQQEIKPVPVKLDPAQHKVTSLAEVLAITAGLGYPNDQIKDVLVNKYGKGTYTPDKSPAYLVFLAEQINSGRLAPNNK